ncbi:MAG: hypothetical protein M1820_008159 [Bogoriella megaspora]|nr:MAG: hypothetical protein M1820_008159 [Bogoriella megaspora]
METSPEHEQPFRLMDLPPEIRNRIYFFAVVSPEQICNKSCILKAQRCGRDTVLEWRKPCPYDLDNIPRDARFGLGEDRIIDSPFEAPGLKPFSLAEPNITLTSRQMRSETLTMFYSLNNFSFLSDNRWTERPLAYLLPWFFALGKTKCKLLGQVTVHECFPSRWDAVIFPWTGYLSLLWDFVELFIGNDALPVELLDVIRPNQNPCARCQRYKFSRDMPTYFVGAAKLAADLEAQGASNPDIYDSIYHWALDESEIQIDDFNGSPDALLDETDIKEAVATYKSTLFAEINLIRENNPNSPAERY